jgi:hypothetical protein
MNFRPIVEYFFPRNGPVSDARRVAMPVNLKKKVRRIAVAIAILAALPIALQS